MHLSTLLIKIILLFSLSFCALAQDLLELTQNPNHNIQEVIESFTKIEDYYSQHNDRRKLFVKIYSFITSGIEDMISSRQVVHGEWLEDLIVGFSEEYRKAVFADVSKDPGNLPMPWRYDFEQAQLKKIGLATQLLLSLNAHILHDLPLTISKGAKSSTDLLLFKEDYFTLNKMFQALTPELFKILHREENIQEDFSNHPSEIIKRLAVNQLVKQMRRTAWQRAMIMADLKTDLLRKIYLKNISQQTLKLSRLVTTLDPFFSTRPGVIFPDHVQQNAWKALKQIHLILGNNEDITNWNQLYQSKLIIFNNKIHLSY